MDQAAHTLMDQPALFDARIALGDSVENITDQRQIPKVVGGKETGIEPVIEIVVGIGDIVGKGRDLSLGAGISGKLEIVPAE